LVLALIVIFRVIGVSNLIYIGLVGLL